MSLAHALLGLDGRTRRLTFAGTYLAVILAATTTNLAGAHLLAGTQGPGRVALLAVLGLVLAVETWCLCAVHAKRLHDIGVSGGHAAWMTALGLCAGLLPEGLAHVSLGLAAGAAMVFLILAVTRGEPIANDYGPVPLPSGPAAPLAVAG
jgi:uncharacterized membrane protein YhaH (DUF805 family)